MPVIGTWDTEETRTARLVWWIGVGTVEKAADRHWDMEEDFREREGAGSTLRGAEVGVGVGWQVSKHFLNIFRAFERFM